MKRNRLRKIVAFTLAATTVMQTGVTAFAGEIERSTEPISVSDALNAQSAVNKKVEEGSFAFFEEMGSTDALDVLNNSAISSYTHKGDAYDATAIDNMLYSLDFIDEYIELRAKEGYTGETYVSDYMMALAQVKTNASAITMKHESLGYVGENLAWGYNDPFDGWYTQEKEEYEKGTTGAVTGHYLNIANKSYDLTGFALTFNSNYRVAHGQEFGFTGSTSSVSQIYTASDYKQRFIDYYNALYQDYMATRINQEMDGANKYIVMGSDDENKKHLTGWYTSAFGDMYLDPDNNGAAVTGCMAYIDSSLYLFDENGLVKKNPGTPIVNGEKYWIKDDEGTIGTGWLYLGNWKMYFDPITYRAYTSADGIVTIDGKQYLFDSNGVMQNFAGTTVIDGNKYWFSTDGASLKTGWLHLGKWDLYFDPETYIAYTSKDGVVVIDGKHCLFNSDGVMQTYAGTTVIDGEKYWFSDEGGSLKCGWLTLGKWKLYFDPTTYRAVRGKTVVIDGKKCTFNEDGILM